MTNTVWFPYAQLKTMPAPIEVETAEGAVLYLKDGRRLIDAISSWWCMVHGYNHPEINQAVKEQVDRLPHVMLGGLIHEQTKQLADTLVKITPEGLNHVFFGDSGSVGVEIALKMALQYWQNLGQTSKTRFLALKKAYHGDTCGAMSVCDPDDGMHALFSGLLPKQLFIESPCRFDADAETVQRDVDALEAMLAKHQHELAGFMLEPIFQGAGGMWFYSPQYLKQARVLCDRYNVLMLFDEVATGFGRTGRLFASEHSGIAPDIMVLGKGLTAGYTSHSATLANDCVYDAFLSDESGKCFMHGPTFMGNPIVCAAANKSIEIFQRDNYLQKITGIEALLREHLLPMRSSKIKETRVLGAIGVIEAHDANDLSGLREFAAERGVWIRPFERYAYTMPPYIITDEQLVQIIQVLKEWF